MLQIVDEIGTVIHSGNDLEIRVAFEFLTIPLYILAEKRGYNMNDMYELNAKYWTDDAKKANGKLSLKYT